MIPAKQGLNNMYRLEGLYLPKHLQRVTLWYHLWLVLDLIEDGIYIHGKLYRQDDNTLLLTW